MTRLFAPLFVLLARCTRNEMARQVQYLKVENAILREKIDGPVRLTGQERARLLKYAQAIPGNILQHLVSVVHYKTVQRWVREANAKRGYAVVKERGFATACVERSFRTAQRPRLSEQQYD